MTPALVRLHPHPDVRFVSRGFTVLTTGLDGFIADAPEQGLFVHETRMLSRWRYLVDGALPLPAALSAIDGHTWLGYYAREAPGNTCGGDDDGSGMMDPASEYTLELQLRRHLGPVVRESAVLTNYTQQPTRFRLEIEADADFADIQEARGIRQQTGDLTRTWAPGEAGVGLLTFAYRAHHRAEHDGTRVDAHVDRRLEIAVRADTPVRWADGRLAFDVVLGPHETWTAEITLTPFTEPLDLLAQATGPLLHALPDDWDARDRAFLDTATAFETAESGTLAPLVTAALNRACHDLLALRLYPLDGDRGAWATAAGLPIYAALYGRDLLTTAWQAAPLGPEMLGGALPLVARLQGTEDVPWRDEQPGKLFHEAHTGPLKVLGYTPTERYYGSLTTSAFYPVAVAAQWHWTGDRDAAFRALGPALDALRWLDTHGDLTGDGFYDYLTRSSQGVKHQAWKDSPDAVVDDQGRFIEPPISTCEEQGFVYQAKIALSEVLWSLGNRDEARRLYGEAEALKARFNEAFWMEDEGYYAFGLDADGRQIRAITSNPLHCLATAIVDSDRAERVAERLFQPDLFTGWGVRTLSSDNPAYNPYSYHRGSVWPVEHGTFALALMRFGLWDRLHDLCRAQFEASALFAHHRLPEVFSGHARTETQPFPAFYPQANSPQAWSASAVFCLVQAMLGLYPYAPFNLLVVDPHLPEWLPELTLRNLRVGQARTTIRFFRKADGTSSYTVQETEGTLHVVRQPSPWSRTAGPAERVVDLLASLLPGK